MSFISRHVETSGNNQSKRLWLLKDYLHFPTSSKKKRTVLFSLSLPRVSKLKTGKKTISVIQFCKTQQKKKKRNRKIQ